MSEEADHPKHLHFTTICPDCSRLLQVRSDGEHFRYPKHDCPKSETIWEA